MLLQCTKSYCNIYCQISCIIIRYVVLIIALCLFVECAHWGGSGGGLGGTMPFLEKYSVTCVGISASTALAMAAGGA